MKKVLILVALFFFGAIHAQEETLRLSLREAISYALENSYNTQIAENNITSAEKRVWETTTIGLPQINASLEYQNFIKQPVSLLPAAAFDNTSAIVETVEDFFNLQATRDPVAPDGFIPVIFGTKQNVNASATLSQLIFDGSYLVGLQASRTYLKISKQAKEKTELATREAVINAYGNVLVSEKSIDILQGNLTIVSKNLEDARKINENGLNEEEDVEQLEITLGNIQNQLLNVERLTEISYQMLNLAIGNPIDRKIVLTDSLSELVQENIALELIAKEFNVNEHIDFKIAENDRESKRLLVKLEQSKNLPTLSAFLNYGSQAFADSFNFFDSSQNWFNVSLVGVNLNVPIFSSFGRKAKTAQAKIDLENADIKLKETKQQLSLQAKKAKSDYQFSIKNYETASKNLALAERIEKKQRIKFFEGLSSSFELLQAQNQLYNQQQSYIQSMLDVIAKKAALENALNIPIK